MTAIGIDFGSCYCRLAYLPAGSTGPQKLGEPVSLWQAVAGKPDEYPYMVIKNDLRPIETIKHIFKYLKKEAESRLDQPVSGCVVSIPVDTGSQYRDRLRSVVMSAGFDAVSLISEPAALVYSQFDWLKTNRSALMYILGESALTLSIYKLDGSNIVEVASRRYEQISGRMLTHYLAQHLVEQLGDGHALTPPEERAWLIEAERLKKLLSGAVEEKVLIPRVPPPALPKAPAVRPPASLPPSALPQAAAPVKQPDGSQEPVIRRKTFDEVIQPYIMQSLELCDELLAAAKMKPDDLGDLWLAGGSRAIPLVGRMLADWYVRWPSEVKDDFAIAFGCARQIPRLVAAARQEQAAPVQQVPARDMPIPAGAGLREEPKSLLPAITSHAEPLAPGTQQVPPQHATMSLASLAWMESERCMAACDFDGAETALQQIDLLLQKQRARIFYLKGQHLEQKALLPNAEPGLLEQAGRAYKGAVDRDAQNQEYVQARDRIIDLKNKQDAREDFQQAKKFEQQKNWHAATERYIAAHKKDKTKTDYSDGAAFGLIMQAEILFNQVIKELTTSRKSKNNSLSGYFKKIEDFIHEARKYAPNLTVVKDFEAAYQRLRAQLAQR